MILKTIVVSSCDCQWRESRIAAFCIPLANNQMGQCLTSISIAIFLNLDFDIDRYQVSSYQMFNVDALLLAKRSFIYH